MNGDLTRHAFRAACHAAPHQCVERWYSFAGMAVRARIVGTALAEYYQQAFASLARPPGAPDVARLTIDLWDEAATGVPCPALNPPVAGDGTIYESLTYAAGGRDVHLAMPDSSTWLDRDAQQITGWRRQARQPWRGEQTLPLSSLLSIWYHDHAVSMLHAGLVAQGDRGVLIAGPSGAGKSTTVLACLCAGFSFLADDLCGLGERGDGHFSGHSLFSTARLDAQHLRRFPLLHARASGTARAGDKARIDVPAVFPGQLSRRTSIRAIVLPRVTPSAPSRLAPAPRVEALRRLVESTLLELTPSLGADGLRALARLVERVPAYWLDVGQDLSAIPKQILRTCHL